MDLRRRQPLWLQQVGSLALNNPQMTNRDHQKIMLEKHWTKTVNSGNPQINFINHQGMIPHLHSHHFQVLPSSTTLPHWTGHQAQNQAPVWPKDIRVMCYHRKHMSSPNTVTDDPKCSPLSISHGMSCHHQVNLMCFPHRLETMPSFNSHLPPIRTTIWRTSEIAKTPPKATISMHCGIAPNICCRNSRVATSTQDI